MNNMKNKSRVSKVFKVSNSQGFQEFIKGCQGSQGFQSLVSRLSRFQNWVLWVKEPLSEVSSAQPNPQMSASQTLTEPFHPLCVSVYEELRVACVRERGRHVERRITIRRSESPAPAPGSTHSLPRNTTASPALNKANNNNITNSKKGIGVDIYGWSTI